MPGGYDRIRTCESFHSVHFSGGCTRPLCDVDRQHTEFRVYPMMLMPGRSARGRYRTLAREPGGGTLCACCLLCTVAVPMIGTELIRNRLVQFSLYIVNLLLERWNPAGQGGEVIPLND